MNTAELDVVIRLYELMDIPRLERCVFSLLGQACGPLRVHLLLQRFSFADVQAVRTALQPVLDLDEELGLTLHNWEHAEPYDLRVPLLNFGARMARGRYLSCLEVGDVLLPGACVALLTRLQATQAVVALGGMAMQHVSWWGDVIQPHPVRVPPTTIHFGQIGGSDRLPPVFLLDRTRLPVQQLVFQSRLPNAEIADFLHRLRGGYAIDVAAATELLGLRQVPI